MSIKIGKAPCGGFNWDANTLHMQKNEDTGKEEIAVGRQLIYINGAPCDEKEDSLIFDIKDVFLADTLTMPKKAYASIGYNQEAYFRPCSIESELGRIWVSQDGDDILEIDTFGKKAALSKEWSTGYISVFAEQSSGGGESVDTVYYINPNESSIWTDREGIKTFSKAIVKGKTIVVGDKINPPSFVGNMVWDDSLQMWTGIQIILMPNPEDEPPQIHYKKLEVYTTGTWRVFDKYIDYQFPKS